MACFDVVLRAEPVTPTPATDVFLSVIVPAVELGLELHRCIDSVRLALADQLKFEILVIVPRRLVEPALVQLTGVKVLAESRPSVYAAMNDGVRASSGRYLYFIGLDDILLPTFSAAIRLMQDENPSVIFAEVYWGGRGTRSTHSSRWAILLRNTCHQGIIYSREAVERHGPYVRRFKVRADQLLNIRILWDESLRTRARLLRVPIAWYAASGLSSRVADRLFYRVQPAIIKRYAGGFWAAAWFIYKRIRPEKGMS
jgi:hypothetical protein